jgi:hypothetical protein
MTVFSKLVTLNNQWVGLSTDAKPTNADASGNVNPGDLFYETDTQHTFKWSGTSWTRYVGSEAIYAYQPSSLSYINLTADASGNLNTTGSGGGGTDPDGGPTGSPVPANASYTGWNSGGNLVGASLSNPFPTQVTTSTYSTFSGTVSASGDNVIRTPTSGKSTQLFYYMVNGDGNNTPSVTVKLRFSSGSAITTISLPPGATLARNIGAGKYYVQGAVNDTLILNLSAAATVNWAIESQEV